jgi:molecular chaperone DnaK
MKKAIGIDLGTTNCCMATADGIHATVLEPRAGETTMPSVIAEDESGNLLVGEEALGIDRPRHRWGFVKRSMGLDHRFQFTRPAPNYSGEQNGAQWTARLISAQYLDTLRRRAEELLGTQELAAVVTVPARFTSRAVEHTVLAAQYAGLDLIETIREPIAAALAWNAEHDGQTTTRCMVYDLGGGTFDVSICEDQEGRFEVAAGGGAWKGDVYLGGFDFDKRIIELVINSLGVDRTKIFATPEPSGEADGEFSAERWHWAFLSEARRVKERLSREKSVEFYLDLHEYSDRPEWLPNVVRHKISRADFVHSISPLIDRTIAFCDEALLTVAAHRRNVSPQRLELRQKTQFIREELEQLDTFLLVGGSTRIPAVGESLSGYFERYDVQLPIREFDPDHCVATGAALHAARCLGKSQTLQIGHEGASRIEWLKGPSQLVDERTDKHPALLGIVRDAIGQDGWHVELTSSTGAHVATAVESTGRFELGRVPLQLGDNVLTASMIDPEGKIRSKETFMIQRAGKSAKAGGALSQCIYVRTRERTLPLLVPEGGEVSQRTVDLFKGDSSKQIRIPIYEGYLLLCTALIDSHAPRGERVSLSASYESGEVKLRVCIGSGEPFSPPIQILDERTVPSRKELQVQVREKLSTVRHALSKVEESAARALEQELQLLEADIFWDLEHVAVDQSKIQDRLGQLEEFALIVEARTISNESLRRRLAELKTRVPPRSELADRISTILTRLERELSFEEVSHLEQEVCSLEHRLPPTRKYDEHDVHLVAQYLRLRLQRVANSAVDNTARGHAKQLHVKVDEIEKRNLPAGQRVNQLLELENDWIGKLYQTAVIDLQNQGLLTEHND